MPCAFLLHLYTCEGRRQQKVLIHETSKRDWIEQIYSTMLISIVKISESFFGRKTSIYAYKGLASQLVAISVRKQILLPMSC